MKQHKPVVSSYANSVKDNSNESPFVEFASWNSPPDLQNEFM